MTTEKGDVTKTVAMVTEAAEVIVAREATEATEVPESGMRHRSGSETALPLQISESKVFIIFPVIINNFLKFVVIQLIM